jgi:hypothetical protein
VGVGFGARFIGPAVGGALNGLDSLRGDAATTTATPESSDPAAGATNVSPNPGRRVAPAADQKKLAELDKLAGQTEEAIRYYRVVSDAFDPSTGICVDVQAVYIGAQDAWFEYSTAGTAKLEAPLAPDRSKRDERLYADMQEVERSFGSTGCPRP